MVPLCNGIMADAVHPQSGKYQTACATVQGHMEYSEVVVFRRYNKGERLSSYLAMVTASFTKAKSMNAVVTMGAINAAYLSCSTDNSGLPLNWQRRASHKEGRVYCGNIGISPAWGYTTLRWSVTGTWIAMQQTRTVVRCRCSSRPHLVR